MNGGSSPDHRTDDVRHSVVMSDESILAGFAKTVHPSISQC